MEYGKPCEGPGSWQCCDGGGGHGRDDHLQPGLPQRSHYGRFPGVRQAVIHVACAVGEDSLGCSWVGTVSCSEVDIAETRGCMVECSWLAGSWVHKASDQVVQQSQSSMEQPECCYEGCTVQTGVRGNPQRKCGRIEIQKVAVGIECRSNHHSVRLSVKIAEAVRECTYRDLLGRHHLQRSVRVHRCRLTVGIVWAVCARSVVGRVVRSGGIVMVVSSIVRLRMGVVLGGHMGRRKGGSWLDRRRRNVKVLGSSH